jgi:hypothetical protein
MPSQPVSLTKPYRPTRYRLTDRDRTILDIERSWWKYEGAKATAIRGRLDVTEVRYYQLLHALLDRPEALEHDPMTVRRLLRLRDVRRRQRRGRRTG